MQALGEVAQGDYCMDAKVYLLVEPAPDTEYGFLPAPYECFGLVLLSQTCDIVNYDDDRTCVEVAPLKMAKGSLKHDIARGKSYKYMMLSQALADKGLYVDLGRTMCITKELAAQWSWSNGDVTEADRRRIASVLGRKRARAAYTKAEELLLKPLSDALSRRHRAGTLGQKLDSLYEIRVDLRRQASPSERGVHIYLVAQDQAAADRLAGLDDECQRALSATADLAKPRCVLTHLDEFKAATYARTEPLDYEYLSTEKS